MSDIRERLISMLRGRTFTCAEDVANAILREFPHLDMKPCVGICPVCIHHEARNRDVAPPQRRSEMTDTSTAAARLPRCPSCGSEYPALRYFMVGTATVCTDFFHPQPTTTESDACQPCLERCKEIEGSQTESAREWITGGGHFEGCEHYRGPCADKDRNDPPESCPNCGSVTHIHCTREKDMPLAEAISEVVAQVLAEPQPAPPATSTGQPKTSPVGKMGSSGYLVTLPDEKPAAEPEQSQDRPASPTCIFCHATGVNPGGVRCECTYAPPNPVGARKWLRSKGWTDSDNDNHRDNNWWIGKVDAFASEQTAALQREKAALERARETAKIHFGKVRLELMDRASAAEAALRDRKEFDRTRRCLKHGTVLNAAGDCETCADNARLREAAKAVINDLYPDETASDVVERLRLFLAAVPPSEPPVRHPKTITETLETLTTTAIGLREIAERLGCSDDAGRLEWYATVCETFAQVEQKLAAIRALVTTSGVYHLERFQREILAILDGETKTAEEHK